jgi:archaellin
MKKGYVSIGTLIIMISLMIISFVLMYNYFLKSHVFASEGRDNLNKEKRGVTNKLGIIDVYTTVSNNKVSQIELNAKLESLSNSVSLNNLKILVKIKDQVATLKYSNGSTNHSPSGYYTLGKETYKVPSQINDDYDEDGNYDAIFINSTTNITSINISSQGGIALGDCYNGVFRKYMAENDYVEDVNGSCDGNTNTYIVLTPKELGKGSFTVEFLREGKNYIPGRIARGDIVNFYIDLPASMGNDEDATITLIPKTGVPTTYMFHTPEYFDFGRVSLSHY